MHEAPQRKALKEKPQKTTLTLTQFTKSIKGIDPSLMYMLTQAERLHSVEEDT